MNDIDKLIEEKLKSHEVAPPAATWETLAGALQQKRRQRRIGYWSAAAALLLVGAAAILIVWLNQGKETAKPVAQEPAVVSRPLATDETLPEDHPIATLGEEKRSVAQPSTPEPVASSETPMPPVAQPPVKKKRARVEELPLTVPPVLAEKETEVLSASQQKPTQPTLVVNASRYKKTDSVTEEQTASADPSEVTVIYQPNPSTLAKKKSIGQQIGKTLTFIQNHGIGFSELRSAKSNLVNRVFSDNEPAEPSDSTTP